MWMVYPHGRHPEANSHFQKHPLDVRSFVDQPIHLLRGLHHLHRRIKEGCGICSSKRPLENNEVREYLPMSLTSSFMTLGLKASFCAWLEIRQGAVLFTSTSDDASNSMNHGKICHLRRGYYYNASFSGQRQLLEALLYVADAAFQLP